MAWFYKSDFLIGSHLPMRLSMNIFLIASGWFQNFIISCHTIAKLLLSDETCSTTYCDSNSSKLKMFVDLLSKRNLLGPLQSFSFLTSFPSKVLSLFLRHCAAHIPLT